MLCKTDEYSMNAQMCHGISCVSFVVLLYLVDMQFFLIVPWQHVDRTIYSIGKCFSISEMLCALFSVSIAPISSSAPLIQ